MTWLTHVATHFLLAINKLFLRNNCFEFKRFQSVSKSNKCPDLPKQMRVFSSWDTRFVCVCFSGGGGTLCPWPWSEATAKTLGPKQNAWCNKTSIMPGLHPTKVLFMTRQTPLLKPLMMECSCWGSRQHCNAMHGYASACRCGGNGCTHSPLTLHWVNLQITLLMYVCMYDSACRCGGKRLHTLPSHPTLSEPSGNTAYVYMAVHAGVGEMAAHTTLSPYAGWTCR